MFKSWKAVVVAVAGLFVLASVVTAARRLPNIDGVLFAGHDGTAQQIVGVDDNGNVSVEFGTSGTAFNVVGAAADDAAASGAPVMAGCHYEASADQADDGDAQRVGCTSRGEVLTALSTNGTLITVASAPTDAVTNSANMLHTLAKGHNFNGSTWDREFSCGSTAVVNVAATATTELVALTASQIVRVCSMVLTADTAATTATIVYGTGSNCATAQVAITGAMRFVDEGNISLSAGNGSLFRGIASNAICLTAATGAVSGFITYAKY